MDARWGAVDLGGVFARAALPCFLLDDAGAMAFANPALHALFGIADGDRAAWQALAAGPLRAPVAAAEGAPQRVGRPAETARGRQWLELLFVPLTLDGGEALGTLGLARVAALPTDLPTAPDGALAERWERHRDELKTVLGFGDVPARGPAMRRALALAKIAAESRCSAAFVGPPGAGKLTLAKLAARHAPPPRGTVALLDAESTPAEAQRDKLLGPHAAAGTWIVRGLGRMPLALQAELAARLAAPHGGWRLLATETRRWDAGVAEGWLQPALYAAVPLAIAVPPLAERGEEFPDLVAALLADLAPKTDWHVEAATLAELRKHTWPGNVRELATALAEMAGRAEGNRLRPGDVPRRLAPAPAGLPPLPALEATLENAERELLRAAAQRFRGNKSKAAEALGISRPRFLRRWEQLGLGAAAEDRP